ncbi:MAG: formate dehydrogenase accessory protein FdhE [Nitrospirota bacterium]
MLTAIDQISDPLAMRLHAIAQDQPALLGAVTVYSSLLPVLRDAVFDVMPLAIDAPEARAILSRGRPVLAELQAEIDLEAQRDLLIGLAQAVEKAAAWREPRTWRPLRKNETDGRASAAGLIRAALEQNRLNVGSLMGHVTASAQQPVTDAALKLGIDADLTWLLLQNSLKPSLRVWYGQIAPWISQVPWQKNFCPLCGAAAAIGELQGNNQEKHLRCGACGADWLGRRLACACCGNEDHRTQQCLYEEGQRDRMRVDACGACNGYLKVISAFSPTPVELLPIEDLATSSLDAMAQARGYQRLLAPS